MKCSYNNKKVTQNQSYARGVKNSSYTMIVIVAYVLCRYNYKARRIKQIINSITDVADSINKGYITHKDIEDIMLEEYDIQLCDKNGEVQRI